jgi:hypothetical protein
LNGRMNIPFCDLCFAKSALGRRVMLGDEESRMAGSKESPERKQQTSRNRL